MYSPTEFLVEVSKVAKTYPGANKHVTAIRNALNVSKKQPSQQRLDAIERALVGGLMTKSFRNNGHMSSLTKAWHKYRQWHHKHARTAFARHTAPKTGLRQLPAHLFDAEIARRLPTANLESLSRAFKSNNPAAAPLKIRRRAFQGELRKLTELGAILLQLPAQAAIQVEDNLVAGETIIQREFMSPVSVKSILRDIPGKEFQFKLTGTHFRAVHTITSRAMNPQSFLIQSMTDRTTDKYMSLSRVLYTVQGSSRAKTVITSHRFQPSWAKIVRDAVKDVQTHF